MSIVVQVRIEEDRDDVDALARNALHAVRSFAPASLQVVLNAAGVDAVALGYDGIHWPERRIATKRPNVAATVSASVHSLEALQRAASAGVDYVQFGPIWEPTWKVATARGLGALAEAVGAAPVPVVAVGGVRPQRVAACMETGAYGVAVVSGVFGATEPADALRRYGQELSLASTKRGRRPGWIGPEAVDEARPRPESSA